MKRAAVVHLAGGATLLATVAASGWGLWFESDARTREILGLEKRRAHAEAEILETERQLQKLEKQLPKDREQRASWLQKRELRKLVDRRDHLEQLYPDNPLARAQARQQAEQLIHCYPKAILDRIDEVEPTRQCLCPPGDPLCSCF